MPKIGELLSSPELTKEEEEFKKRASKGGKIGDLVSSQEEVGVETSGEPSSYTPGQIVRTAGAYGLPMVGQAAGAYIGGALAGPGGAVVGEALGGAGTEAISQLAGLSEPSLTQIGLAAASGPVGRGLIRGGSAAVRGLGHFIPGHKEALVEDATREAIKLIQGTRNKLIPTSPSALYEDAYKAGKNVSLNIPETGKAAAGALARESALGEQISPNLVEGKLSSIFQDVVTKTSPTSSTSPIVNASGKAISVVTPPKPVDANVVMDAVARLRQLKDAAQGVGEEHYGKLRDALIKDLSQVPSVSGPYDAARAAFKKALALDKVDDLLLNNVHTVQGSNVELVSGALFKDQLETLLRGKGKDAQYFAQAFTDPEIADLRKFAYDLALLPKVGWETGSVIASGGLGGFLGSAAFGGAGGSLGAAGAIETGNLIRTGILQSPSARAKILSLLKTNGGIIPKTAAGEIVQALRVTTQQPYTPGQGLGLSEGYVPGQSKEFQ